MEQPKPFRDRKITHSDKKETERERENGRDRGRQK